MRGLVMNSAAGALVILLAGTSSGPAVPADFGASLPANLVRPADEAATIDFARREAVLLLVRQTFTLLDTAGVVRELAASNVRRRIGQRAPAEAEHLALDRGLLAEGSYYLVSLRYLILAGGAAWPADRPARSYDNDAIVKLDALQKRLFEAVATRADPLPIFLEAQEIWALTEGYKEVPEQLDVFGHRDELVEMATEDAVPHART